jgi:hypothetical protein
VVALREAFTDTGQAEAVAPGAAASRTFSMEPGEAGGDAAHPRGLRAVHQAVLRHFPDIGTAPGPDALKPVAAHAGRAAWEVLAQRSPSNARDVSIR